MRRMLKLTLLIGVISTACFSQEDTNPFGEEDFESLSEEGNLQSDIPSLNSIDYSELDNPEFQEINPGEDPLWNNDDQNLDFNELPVEE